MLDVHQKQDLENMKKRKRTEAKPKVERRMKWFMKRTVAINIKLLQNISLMDGDLVLVCAEKISNLILLLWTKKIIWIHQSRN